MFRRDGGDSELSTASQHAADFLQRTFAVNEAEDIGQIAALEETVTVPLGTFTGCVRTREWSMLESGTSKRWYAKGLGLVRDETTGNETSVLVSVTRK